MGALWRDRLAPLAALLTIALGGALSLAGHDRDAARAWTIGVLLLLVPLSLSVARSLLRGDAGVDLIALIAIVGTLLVGEQLAGAVVSLMLAGGNALEAAAGSRARRELTALVSRAPRIAHRQDDGGWQAVPVEDVGVGDVLLVRAGEIVPVDGTVRSPVAVLDESALTGEPLPVSLTTHQPVRSGSANAGDAFEMRATRPAAESAYAALVRLVEAAETQRAPFVRMADRYALGFLALTLGLSGIAWAISGDAVRAVAVLVVATPCPLILAAPVALISGVSRAARRGIIVKGGGVIERLGSARTVLLDKTGTLTHGQPELEAVEPAAGFGADEILRLAASIEQYSVHVTAAALVHAAVERGLDLVQPTDVREEPGQGISGVVDGRRVAIGSPAFLAIEVDSAEPGTVLLAVDGVPAGTFTLADRLRPDATGLVPALRAAGVVHVALVSGDRRAVAEQIGEVIGVDEVYADQSPEAKLEVVRAIRSRPELRAVVMVGDGINDAPALALADVGIAMAGAGATVSAEAADAVITVDRVDRVADAIAIGRRSLFIARQSVLVGMGLSVVAMLVAAAGLLPPVAGALVQEAIDVAVILNALRALRA